MKLVYLSTQETGTFSSEIDIWESVIYYGATTYYINSGNVTVAIQADQSYHLTGTLECVLAEDETQEQQFVLDLHRAAPMVAKDTVSLTANGTWSHTLNLMNWSDVAVFDATQNGTQLHFAYNGWASYTGELEGGLIDPSTYVKHGGIQYAVERFESGQVDLNNDKTYTLTAGVLFKDSSFYNLQITAPIPTPVATDTIELTNLHAEENPMSGDLELRASNDDLEFVIYQQNGILADGHIEGAGVSAEISNLVTYDAVLAYYVSADLNVSRADSQVVVADIYAANDTLYHVIMTYVIPAAQDTIEIQIQGCKFTNMENSGQYRLDGTCADYDVALTIQSTYFEVEDSFYNLDIKDWLVSQYSYVINNATYDQVSFLVGTCSAQRDAQDSVVFSANVLGSDAHFYRIVLGGKWERRHLEQDMQTGDINFAFSSNDSATIDVTPALQYNAATFEVTDQAKQHSLALNFFIDPANLDESNLKIPAGTYPINDTYSYGTAQPSGGVEFDFDLWEYVVTPCLFVQQKSGSTSEFEYYFLVEGNVTVSYPNDQLQITVDAYNSYDRHVQVTYGAQSTALESTAAPAGVTKRIENGQFLIQKSDKTYTAAGLRLR